VRDRKNTVPAFSTLRNTGGCVLRHHTDKGRKNRFASFLEMQSHKLSSGFEPDSPSSLQEQYTVGPCGQVVREPPTTGASTHAPREQAPRRDSNPRFAFADATITVVHRPIGQVLSTALSLRPLGNSEHSQKGSVCRVARFTTGSSKSLFPAAEL
jgi:hypothetical protein